MGRTYSCWMLNCWCITWPVGFRRLFACENYVYVRTKYISINNSVFCWHTLFAYRIHRTINCDYFLMSHQAETLSFTLRSRRDFYVSIRISCLKASNSLFLFLTASKSFRFHPIARQEYETFQYLFSVINYLQLYLPAGRYLLTCCGGCSLKWSQMTYFHLGAGGDIF